MEQVKWSYYQYRKSFDYPVYLRQKNEDVNPKFTHVFSELGFTPLSEAEAKKIPLHKANTRILTIQEASARLQLQINGSDLLDKYGHESLSLQGGMPVYTYRKVGIMGVPAGRPLWDLALNPDLSNTDQMVGLRIVLVRFLAQALSDQGVLSYWGTVKDDTILVMKQGQSFGEAVFIDASKRMIFSNAGEIKLGSSLRIVRKDKEVSHASQLSREDIIGFMSVSTCLLSFNGISPAMKKAIYALSTQISASYAVSESVLNL